MISKQSDKRLNDFNFQTILLQESPASCVVKTPLKHKFRHSISEPSFNDSNILKILYIILNLNKIMGIYTSNDIFEFFSESYFKNFAKNTSFKLIRRKNLLTEIVNPTEQQQTINDYHKNDNHRGTDETFLHLKRSVYFPYRKYKIAQTLKNCEVCLILKYDRLPQKPPFQTPEYPSMQMHVVQWTFTQLIITVSLHLSIDFLNLHVHILFQLEIASV